MRDPSRVRLGGPLEPFAAGFVAELGRLGYARPSVDPADAARGASESVDGGGGCRGRRVDA